MNLLKYSWCIAAAVLCFISCKKDADVSVKEFVAYNASGTTAYNVMEGEVTVLRENILSESGKTFPILLSRAFDKDVQATAVIDMSLVKVYDSLYGSTTPSLTPPAGAFELVNNGMVTIKAGETYSSDSMKVKLADASKLKAGVNTYIIPVVLQTANNEVPVSTTRRAMFVKTKVISVGGGVVTGDGRSDYIYTVEKAGTQLDFKGAQDGVITLKATINQPVNQDFRVKVKENLSLVESYNTKNGTDYSPFPSETFVITDDEAIITANKGESSESTNPSFVFKVLKDNLSLFDLDKERFLLPLEVITTNDPALLPGDPEQVFYVKLEVEVNNIDQSNAELTGDYIDRTDWLLKASHSYGDRPEVQAIDGDNGTSWLGRPDNGVFYITLDMGTENKLQGFEITPNYTNNGKNENFDLERDVLSMEVYSSSDGTNWKKEGTYNGPSTDPNSTANNPDYKYVRFIKPVTARYFKFENISTDNKDGKGGFGELKAIK